MEEYRDIVERFGQICAYRVVKFWDAPPGVIEFLRTGDKRIKTAAWEEIIKVPSKDTISDMARDAAKYALIGNSVKEAADAAIKAETWVSTLTWDELIEKQDKKLTEMVLGRKQGELWTHLI